ncbi:MAG: GAF domain-containing protein [Mucilaginibacter sp.]|nr:GAF domain-containing protein [Mucilaginibacter sp.]
MSQNGYSKIELGQSALSVQNLLTIADTLAVTVNQLLGEVDIAADVQNIGAIPICRKLLEVVCRTTGMGFAAIARVTDDRWVACSVLDEIKFGLKPGDELPLATTICNEIRASRKLVVIDHIAADPVFATHPTPAMYGFQSYISVPIFRQDDSFFGTLCAIDPKPAQINNAKTISLFTLFAQLISFHLDAVERSVIIGDTPDQARRAELEQRLSDMLGADLPQPVRNVLDRAG